MSALLYGLGQKPRRIVSECSERIWFGIEFLFEGARESPHGGIAVLRVERCADVCTVRRGGVGNYALPSVATDEYRVESLTTRFSKYSECGRFTAGDEDYSRLLHLQIGDEWLRLDLLFNGVEAHYGSAEGATESVGQPTAVGVVLIENGCALHRGVIAADARREPREDNAVQRVAGNHSECPVRDPRQVRRGRCCRESGELTIVDARRGEHRSRVYVADHRENLGIIDEVLRDCGGARSVGFVVSRHDLERATVDSAGAVDLLCRKIDPATRHLAVPLFPGAGGTDSK